MAYERVYAQRINWENEPSQNTALEADNLNYMDYAIYTHDEAIENLDITKANEDELSSIQANILTLQTTKANQSDLLLDIKSVEYNSSTGVWKFTHQNGTVNTFDQNIEKIPVSFSMSPQGVITMTTADGTTFTADIASLIKTYTFTDSSVIDFTTTTDSSGNKTITANIIDGSITGAKLQPNYLADCRTAQTQAQTAATDAQTYSGQASTSATSANNSATLATTKAGEANTSASIASTKASEADASATSAGNSALTASTKASEASTSATSANQSATIATTKAQEASQLADQVDEIRFYSEAYAIGTEDGEPVPSTHPAYDNNSKYYSDLAKTYRDEAETIVGIGIATTEKAGIVKPDGETVFVDVAGKITAGISENDWITIQNLLG